MRSFVLIALIAGLASMALAADKVENPVYKTWATQKVGTVVKFHITTNDKTNSQTDMVWTLMEVTPEKVVVDTVYMPKNFNQSRPIPAMIDPATTQRSGPASKPGTTLTITQGDEVVKAAGRSFPCHWTATTEKSASETRVITSWNCPDVPGGEVKFDITDGTTQVMTRVLTYFKVP